MNKIQERLTKCFLAVFPDLTEENAPNATPKNIKEWDSVASVTLFATIEEEFEIEIPVDDLADFVAYDRIAVYLESKLPVS